MIIDYPDNLNLLAELKNKSIASSEEICGFIRKNNLGFYEFTQCKNLHPEPDKYFLISPKDYLSNIDTILFHSHPESSNLDGFSDWDLENQKFFCLDMLLYSVNKDKFYFNKV